MTTPTGTGGMTALLPCHECNGVGLVGPKPGARYVCNLCDGEGKFRDRRALAPAGHVVVPVDTAWQAWADEHPGYDNWASLRDTFEAGYLSAAGEPTIAAGERAMGDAMMPQRFPREEAIEIGRSVKTIRLTWFERSGRAILAGCSDEEIEELANDHFGEIA